MNKDLQAKIEEEARKCLRHNPLRHETFYYELGVKCEPFVNWLVSYVVELAREQDYRSDFMKSKQEILAKVWEEIGK